MPSRSNLEETVINWKHFPEYRNDTKELLASVLDQTEALRPETDDDSSVMMSRISAVFAKSSAPTKTGSAPLSHTAHQELFTKRMPNEATEEIQEKIASLQRIIEKNHRNFLKNAQNAGNDKEIEKSSPPSMISNEEQARDIQEISSCMLRIIQKEISCREASRNLDEGTDVESSMARELFDLIFELR